MLDADTALLIVLAGAIGLGLHAVARTNAPVARADSMVALGLIGLVVIPTMMQLTIWPSLEGRLRRAERQIVHHGQIWRIATSLLVQDGGWAGGIFNVATLALLALLAVRLIGPRRMMVAFGVGALAGEIAGLWWQPTGAGNSVGNCGLAAAVLAFALLREPTPTRIAAGGMIAVGGTLPLHRDIHGAAFIAALLVMLGWWLISNRRATVVRDGREASPVRSR